jgi:hypothetical protein
MLTSAITQHKQQRKTITRGGKKAAAIGSSDLYTLSPYNLAVELLTTLVSPCDRWR